MSLVGKLWKIQRPSANEQAMRFLPSLLSALSLSSRAPPPLNTLASGSRCESLLRTLFEKLDVDGIGAV